jgi:gamma-glutamylputrescine oxidase
MAEAVTGPSPDFDLMAQAAPPPFPGGVGFRTPVLALAMTWYALRDRLGL